MARLLDQSSRSTNGSATCGLSIMLLLFNWGSRLLLLALAILNLYLLESKLNLSNNNNNNVGQVLRGDFVIHPSSTTEVGFPQREMQRSPRDILESARVIDPGSFPTLPELVRATEEVTCPTGLFPVLMVVNETADRALGRRIPQAIHMTGEVKCLTETFFKNTLDWSLEGHSFYFHDRQAKESLLARHWPEFPHLQNAYQCLKNAGGAAVSDLWRYLLLWQYGGIYSDIDNGIGPLFHAHTIGPEVDGFFLKGAEGPPSQYFLGISPRHPLMWFAVNDVLDQMMHLKDVGNFFVPGTTGPRCIKRSWFRFMGLDEENIKKKESSYWTFFYPTGHYVGTHNRSLEIVGGDKETRKKYVKTSHLHWAKKTDWALMNFTNYYDLNKVPHNKSCLELLLEKYSQTGT
jgi:mannosyltransferase OCH1-like enzyme